MLRAVLAMVVLCAFLPNVPVTGQVLEVPNPLAWDGELPPLIVRPFWDASPEGSMPVSYNIEIREFLNPEVLFEYQVAHEGAREDRQSFLFEDGLWGVEYEMRVQAVDAQGRTSDWSPWCDRQDYTLPPDDFR